MTLKEKADMRKGGATYQQIADACGVSRQAVHQQVVAYDKKLAGRRMQLSRIRYKGLYDHFANHPEESLSMFANVVYGYRNVCVQTMRKFMYEGVETKFTINQIKKMCKRCGKSFEEVFTERNIDE